MDEKWAIDDDEYPGAELFELGDAARLTLGQTGPDVDSDAQPSPDNGTPAS